jgi:hypothetical protein
MPKPPRVKLIAGPYTPPPLKRGDVATCLFRDGDVIITNWSNGRISWPRCQRPRQKGGSGLLVTEELVRPNKLLRFAGQFGALGNVRVGERPADNVAGLQVL